MSNAQSAFEYFVGQGLAPHQAAGIVGNLQGESGQGLNPLAVNPRDGRDGSDSVGIAQWNGTRAQALKEYAASKGAPWTDLTTQLEFLHSELKGPESKAYQALLAAQNPDEAARAFLGFERPKDWNKPGSHPERVQNAAAVFKAYGQPAQATPTAPSSGPLQIAQPGGPLQPAAQPSGPLQLAPQAVPTQAQPQGGDIFSQMNAMGQPPPIMFPQRRSPDLSKLRSALGQAGGFSFPRRG